MGELQGERLARVPKGFDPEHASADLVRAKQWLLDAELDAAVAATPKLQVEIVRRFRAMTPFVEFLNAPLVEGLKSRKARWED
jgi:uncharacterized protein (DUF2461 family)